MHYDKFVALSAHAKITYFPAHHTSYFKENDIFPFILLSAPVCVPAAPALRPVRFSAVGARGEARAGGRRRRIPPQRHSVWKRAESGQRARGRALTESRAKQVIHYPEKRT